MLITIDKFGGTVPQVIDPALLPTNKSQQAVNCRTDRGGITALQLDQPVVDQAKDGTLLSIYRYSDGNFFTWTSDVDVCAAPNPADAYGRVYYTENGEFRVTDKNLYKSGGSAYPMAYYNPCPPAPATAPTATSTTGTSPVTALIITDRNCLESDGTYNLNFSGGGGTGATGTYTVVSNLITVVSLVGGGAYTSNPAVSTQTGDGAISATGVLDSTLQETRGYVYTFVNGYGAEGPPSPVSELVNCYDGDTISISDLATSPGAIYNITKVRIYRLNQSSSGSEYQFVTEINIGETSFSDEILDDELGEVLATAEWDSPPLGLQGLIALPNGALAGFVGNLLCFSVPGYPHAWPAGYQKSTDRPIVAIGSFGTTVAVLTSGTPYLAVGNDPSNVVMEAMDLGHACMSKRGRVQAGDLIIYPSPEGLVAIGSGVREVITDGILTRQDWQSKYNPSLLDGYYWEGKYVGFYDNNGVKAGFLFDIKTKDLVDLTFYASAGYRDPGTGVLYLSLGG